MKKLSLFFAGLCLLSAVVGCILGVNAKNISTAFSSDRSVRGSGKIVSRTMDSEPFDAIEASRSVKVVVARTGDSGIRIEADDNVMEQIMIHVKGRTLHVGLDKSVNNVSDIHVTVTVPYSERLGRLEASRAAKIVCKEPLQAPEVTLKASSAAQIEAAARTGECEIKASSAAQIKTTVECSTCEMELSSSAHIAADVTATECDVDLSSASKLELKGSADRFEADCSSAAVLAAGHFEARKADIDTSSASSARIRCTGSLKARASSGSSIRYSGNCRVDSNASSGGSIRKN